MQTTPEPPLTVTPWRRPPQAGYTLDDLYELPDLPPHTQLIDGSLVFATRQQAVHSVTTDLLESGLRCTVPDQLRVRRQMLVVLTRRTVPEPDVSVVRAEAEVDADHTQTRYEAKDVVLAVEVVSPDSVERDRDTKPHKYARAGIPHFWRVEMTGDEGHPVAYVYELDTTTMAYVVTGIHHDHLKLSVPFHVDIDLTEIDRM